ncbi:hypothetical protein ACFWU5_03840 [Nocardia sp. NPDC058640]|uniref:hypothetical protein n=1 Tax=Nocardia sp. NPDC058640 TaxID=3346571 RepID=UPI003669964B
MTGPLDKPSQSPHAPVAWDPPTQADLPAPRPDPADFAPLPYAAPQHTQPYPPAPQQYPPHQGYAMPPSYPMPGHPMVSVTQNNGMGAHTIVVHRGVNHGLHLVLTLLTCGLWLPVWVIAMVIDAMNNN